MASNILLQHHIFEQFIIKIITINAVFITGCSRGIGFETAQLLLKNGYTVYGTSTSGHISISSDQFQSLQLKLEDEQSIMAITDYLKNIEISVIINNAAILMDAPGINSISISSLKRTFDINLFGTITLTEQLIPILRDGTHIINVSSGWGTFSDICFNAYAPNYKLSKAALNMYTKLLAERLRPRNIRVNALDPGWVKTDMGGENATKSPEITAQEILDLFGENTATGNLWRNGTIVDW